MDLLSAYAVDRAKGWLARISGGALVFWSVAALTARSWLPPTHGCASARGDAKLWCHGSSFDVVTLSVYGILAIAAAVGSTLVVATAAAPVIRILSGSSWPVTTVLARWTARRTRRHQELFDRLCGAPGRSTGQGATPNAIPRAAQSAALTTSPAPPPVTPLGGSQASTPRSGATPTGATPALLPSAHTHPAAPACPELTALALARNEAGRRRYPRRPEIQPTRIGNSLAATAERVTGRHGWDLAICWELIDLALPDHLAARLRGDSDRVTTRAQNLLWAVLTCLVAVVGGSISLASGTGRALVLGAFLAGALGSAVGAYLLFQGLCTAVDAYGDSVEAVLVAGRADIYRAAGWPAPATPEEETKRGGALSGYLSRAGYQEPATQFTVSADPQPLSSFGLTPLPATPPTAVPQQGTPTPTIPTTP